MCSYYVMLGAACILFTLMVLNKVGEWVQVQSSNACVLISCLTFHPVIPAALVFFAILYYEYKEGWALKNWYFQIVVLENTLENPLDSKEIKSVSPKGNQHRIYYWKDWCQSYSILATWCEELTHWKGPWCWERLKAGGKGDDREWDDWMASSTQWTWVWASSRRYWRTGKPGMLPSMGWQRVRCDSAMEQQRC